MRKAFRSLASFLLMLCLVASLANAETATVTQIQKYGNLILSISGTDFLAAGYDYGDMVQFDIAGKAYDMPVGSNYSDVDVGKAVCCIKIDIENGENHVVLALNMDDLASDAGVAEKITIEAEPGYLWEYAEGIETPLQVKFRLKEAGAYRNEWLLRQAVRTNERSDYSHLSDAEFANFRPITTTGMGENKLYRSSSPVNPELGRSEYADAAMRKAGIATVINLADNAISYEGWEDSYYHGCDITALGLAIDFEDEHFQNGFAEGMRAIIAGNAPYLVHCTEGKDRAGFVSAVLECLMGASADEVISDYMTTYYNYYGIEPGTEQYIAVVESNILQILATAFEVQDIRAESVDLAAEAQIYMLQKLALSADEIAKLKSKLS